MKKMILLALAAASVAMFALPAVASAGTWHTEPVDGSTTQTFTVTGGAGTLTSSGGNVSCTSTSGGGHYENTTTGTMTIVFHGCTTPNPFGGAPINCSTSGQPTGTITTTKLPFHNVILDVTAGGVKDPGILVTPAAGAFAHFSCSFISVKVEGNGLLGQITSPACGAKSKSATIEFTDVAGKQEWTQVTTTGTSYGLIRSGNPVVMQTNATIALQKESTLNCT